MASNRSKTGEVCQHLVVKLLRLEKNQGERRIRRAVSKCCKSAVVLPDAQGRPIQLFLLAFNERAWFCTMTSHMQPYRWCILKERQRVWEREKFIHPNCALE